MSALNIKELPELEEIRILAEQLMKKHKLSGWKFVFANSVRNYGYCNHDTKKIAVSRKLALLNDLKTTTNTILHEIAHAIAGPSHGHDLHWKGIAIEIGCDGSRLYDSTKVVTPERKYRGECPCCKRVIYRYRRKTIACGNCCTEGVFDKRFTFVFSEV